MFGIGEVNRRLETVVALLKVILKREVRIMSLSEEVKVALADVSAKIDGAVIGVGEAVVDIQGLHAKLDELLASGDVAGAQAALADAQAKAGALADAVASLKVVVDLPE